jgi:nitrous oxidase accessory protein
VSKLSLSLLAVLLVCWLPLVHAASKTLIVPDEYANIQSAIDAANAGDTILVKPGMYFENLKIDKPLTLQGNDAIIDGNHSEYAVWVKLDGVASNVTIEGFVIQNAGNISGLSGGIRLSYVENCTIQNCTFIGNRNGVVLEHAANIEIAENTMINSSNVGIYVYSSENNVIVGNIAVGNFHGVGLDDSANNRITDNLIANSTVAGIYLAFFYSQNNQVSFNNISFCEIGIYISTKASGTAISNNRIFNNSYGVKTFDAGNSTLIDNTFSNNQIDIIPEFSIFFLPLFLTASGMCLLLKKRQKRTFGAFKREFSESAQTKCSAILSFSPNTHLCCRHLWTNRTKV